MRYALVILALFAFAAPATASLQVDWVAGDVLETSIPASNDFAGDLTGLGLNGIVQGDVKITANGYLRFYAHASESGYINTFVTPAGNFTENPDVNPWTEILIGQKAVTSGDTFSSLGIRFETLGPPVGSHGPGTSEFGIFVPATNVLTYSTTRIYLGYDDNGAGPDDNHDDLIVSVVFTPAPVPEATTLAIWGGLFGIAGLVAGRFRRRHNQG